jgi:hypothetical protein
MPAQRYWRIVLAGVVLAAIGTAAFFWGPAMQQAPGGSKSLALVAPPFLTAKAETLEATGVIQAEAGIAAWYNAGTAVNLNQVRTAYRVVELQTADYIIGSVPVPDHAEEAHDVHLYIHRDGWFLAYYLKADPVAKIIDWEHFNNSIPTKFETVLGAVAAVAGLPAPQGINYYHFDQVNATKMMLVYEDAENGNDFRIKLTNSYVYYVPSWNVDGWSAEINLNNKRLGGCGGTCTTWGFIAATDFAPDLFHTFTVNQRGGLGLLYRDIP